MYREPGCTRHCLNRPHTGIVCRNPTVFAQADEATNTPVAAISASDNDPLTLCDRVQRRQPRVCEVDLNLSQHCPHASTPYLPAIVLAVLGETACCRVEVAAIERLIEWFGDAPVGFGNVQGSPPWRHGIASILRCIPVGMRRPAVTRTALGFSPLVEASWTHSARIESIPYVAAGARAICVLWAETSRRAGSGFGGRTARGS